MGLALNEPIADNLSGIVDARRRNKIPAGVGRDEFVQVGHPAFAKDVRVLRPASDSRSANDLAAIVNASGVAERSAERAQIGHHAITPEAGMEGPSDRIGQASHFAAIIDGSSEAHRAARERSEVGYCTVAEDDGAREPSR